jgi:hypothetical protein
VVARSAPADLLNRQLSAPIADDNWPHTDTQYDLWVPWYRTAFKLDV